VNCCSSPPISGSTPPPLPCVKKYHVYSVYGGGEYGVLGLEQINICRKVPSKDIFLDDDILHCLLWVLSFYAYTWLALPSAWNPNRSALRDPSTAFCQNILHNRYIMHWLQSLGVKFLVPDWGYSWLWHRAVVPARQPDKPMPQSTISPQSGTENLAIVDFAWLKGRDRWLGSWLTIGGDG
jgi:hypothetical protein